MRVLVSHPGTFMDAQQAARAFHERGALAAFVTGFAFAEGGAVARIVDHLPEDLGRRLRDQLRRRQVTEVPPASVVCYPWLEGLRTALSRFVETPVLADLAWDALSHRFDRTVGQGHLERVEAVHGFEYTAEYTFAEAARRGIAKILALPSTDSKEFEDIKNAEESKFPELRGRRHRYFADRFARRYERRRREIALADLIVANSEVTRRSHIRAGADPAKIVAVPLAAPPPIDAIGKPEGDIQRPLSAVWAGSLILRKGAHYFIEAWRALRAGERAHASVYGAIGVPERLLRPLPPQFDLKGSVPQPELMAAFERADVLVFPTLADGFGMVVAEAFSRGLPVITTDRAGASGLVEHGRNGLIIRAGESASLVEALRWCLDNRRALYEMRSRALAAAQRWQWPDYRELLIAKVAHGLRRAGYEADFGPGIADPSGSAWREGLASAS